jgi:putative ABC transport system permease protein
MLRWYCRALLRAFPHDMRDRIGRSLAQTLATDCRAPGGRVALTCLFSNSVDLIRAGLAERLARRRADREPRRDLVTRLRALAADLSHARASLRRRPTFAVTVFLTIALGIGLNTAVFSIVHRVLVAELPYRDPSRLGFIWTKLAWIGVPRAWMAAPHIDRLGRETSTIEELVPLRTNDMQMVGGDAPVIIRAGMTNSRLFDVLGTRPLYGRTFVLEDEPRNVVVLGHAIWKGRFGADPAIVGRSIEVGGDQMEVLGVLPEDFRFLVHASLGSPREPDLWIPVQWQLSKMNENAFAFAALVRVRPGRTLAEAQAELDTIGARLDRERYKSRGFGWQLVGVQEDLVKDARPALLLILGGSGLVLLVVAANIAGLVLVRQGDRRRELGVRAALGASRRDLVRLVLVECLALSLTAGVAGVALAWILVRAIVASGALPVPRLDEVGLDVTVLLFSLALAIATGLAAAAVPAWRAGRRDAGHALADAARGSSGRVSPTRAVLVAIELALAVVLLAGGALLARSYVTLRAVDPGFDGSGTLAANIQLLMQRYPQEAQAVDFFHRLTDQLRLMPDVTAVGASSSPPLSGDTDQASLRPDGWVPRSSEYSAITADLFRSTPGYFAAMGISLRSGRDFTWSDRAGTQPVAVIDERLAKESWPGADPLGRTIAVDDAKLTVVGVVRHARVYRLEEDDRPQIYRPYAQDTLTGLTVALRTHGDPERLYDPLRRAVLSLDPKQPIGPMTTMREAVDSTLAGRRLQIEAIGAFAIGAAALAALGLYGVLASFVGERRREIGIRMALGAGRAQVRRLIGVRVLAICGAGLAIGLLAALPLARLIAPMLYGVSPQDPVALSITIAALALLILMTTYLPLRRALRVDPSEALRGE